MRLDIGREIRGHLRPTHFTHGGFSTRHGSLEVVGISRAFDAPAQLVRDGAENPALLN